MKILVSSYACDPYRGSEPGVGWAAILQIAKHHDVFVLTDIHNVEGIERAKKEGLVPENITFRILRDHSQCSENRLLAHFQSWMNYANFSKVALHAAREWHKEVTFDLCHQVTIAGWRVPSLLWQLPIPFVWGPIGGAGYIPKKFRGMLSRPAKAFERIRDINTQISLRSSSFRKCIENTAVVIAANEETRQLLKPYRNQKPLLRLPIVSIPEEKIIKFSNHGERDESKLKLFAGGNMEGRKGVSLALKALAIVAKKGIDFEYTIAGGGPEIESLKQLAHSLGIYEKINFHMGYSGGAYVQALQESHIYFLPSFRESTPVTLIEAYIAGCYPVVADTSAQGEIVNYVGGHAVAVENVEQLITGLADGVIWAVSHRDEISQSYAQRLDKIREYFSAQTYVDTIEQAYQLALQQK